MSSGAADQFAFDDAAYVLGALSVQRRARFDDHLQGCAACRDRVLAASETAALLAEWAAGPAPSVHAAAATTTDSRIAARVDTVPVVNQVRQPPDSMLAGLLSRAALRRRRRLRAGVTAGLLVAAGIAAAGVAVRPLIVDDRTPVVASRDVATGTVVVADQPMQTVVDSSVTATASLVAQDWGTEIELHCRHSSVSGSTGPGSVGPGSVGPGSVGPGSVGPGSAPPSAIAEPSGVDWYRLVVVGRDGVREPAGSWTVPLGSTQTSYVGGTWLTADDIARVLITLPDGHPVLELRR